MLRLVVYGLARPALPRGTAAVALARALRRGLRHRRGQQHLLPPADRERGPWLGRADARRLLLHRQGEPLFDPREAPEGDADLCRALLRADPGAGRVPEARPGPVAAPRELPSRRRTPRRRARGAPPWPP